MLVCKSWNVLLNETQIDQKLVQYNGFLRVLLLRVHLNLIYLLILNGEKLNDPTVAAMYIRCGHVVRDFESEAKTR